MQKFQRKKRPVFWEKVFLSFALGVTTFLEHPRRPNSQKVLNLVQKLFSKHRSLYSLILKYVSSKYKRRCLGSSKQLSLDLVIFFLGTAASRSFLFFAAFAKTVWNRFQQVNPTPAGFWKYQTAFINCRGSRTLSLRPHNKKMNLRKD